MRYEVVIADCQYTIERLVNEKLAEGWELQGGVSMAITYDDHEWTHWYAQAIVKREEPNRD
jgi:hypothetical protein